MAKGISTTARGSQLKPTELRAFHAALTQWYKTHGRHDLPWRNTDDPYHIWLSEVMLQQTQVATVRERFYGPFLQKFPSVAALAAAPTEAVMKAWEGLGYYSRARNLHKAAQKIDSEGGLAPYAALTPAASGSPEATHRLVERWMTLPGIGRNTASAIAAFAFHQPVAILEANVKRIVARVFALERPRDDALWPAAEILLNTKAPFDYNQAMMDVGALVCTPKNPRCGVCPASAICKGKTSPERYPAPKTKKRPPTREAVIYVREDVHGRLFLEARDAKLLGGLYGFPQTTIHHSPPTTHCLGTVTHTYSHFKLVGRVVHEKLKANSNSKDWHSRAEIATLPLSTLDHKVLALVDNCNSRKKKKPKKATHVRSH